MAFMQRLKNETDFKTLTMTWVIPSLKYMGYWRQYLNPEQIHKYKQDPR